MKTDENKVYPAKAGHAAYTNRQPVQKNHLRLAKYENF